MLGDVGAFYRGRLESRELLPFSFCLLPEAVAAAGQTAGGCFEDLKVCGV